MTIAALRRLIASGEGPTLEFKRSTGELREGMRTACAFLNCKGGEVAFGIKPDGTLVGQEVSDKTLREIAQAMDSFEPPARIEIERVGVAPGREVVLLHVGGLSDTVPFTFEGQACERVGSTTRKMPQDKYEKLLLERAHSRRRWENQEAEGTGLQDIDREEVFRVVEAARASGRLVEPVQRDLGRILGRLGVRRGGVLLRAAVVLFGKRFLPDFPQCELRLARFRGVDKAEFLDQKMVRGPAFKLLEEAELFCHRHLPLPGRIASGRFQRIDTPLIPPDALREIVVNAVIHRDYTIAGGAVSLAIFDNRVEIWSAGRFPSGITAEVLTRDHDSVLRNPIIAEMFYRAGFIEKWGRGTNRVADMCRQHGIAPPEFSEVGSSVAVTFRVNVGQTTQVTPQVTPHVTPQVIAILQAAGSPRSRGELQEIAGLRDREHFRKFYLEPLVAAGWLEMTIPDKPRSRLQRYRVTEAGAATL